MSRIAYLSLLMVLCFGTVRAEDLKADDFRPIGPVISASDRLKEIEQGVDSRMDKLMQKLKDLEKQKQPAAAPVTRYVAPPQTYYAPPVQMMPSFGGGCVGGG